MRFSTSVVGREPVAAQNLELMNEEVVGLIIDVIVRGDGFIIDVDGRNERSVVRSSIEDDMAAKKTFVQ